MRPRLPLGPVKQVSTLFNSCGKKYEQTFILSNHDYIIVRIHSGFSLVIKRDLLDLLTCST